MMNTHMMYRGLNISRRKCISSMNPFGMTQIGSIFIAALMQGFPELSRSYVTDKRQEFLLEDILEDFDNGLLCGSCMHHDRHGDHSSLLRDLDTRNVDIPVPLRHILPQKFSTPSLVSTLNA